MDIKINLDDINSKNIFDISKMMFIYNTLQDGWEVKKIDNKYIFTKNIEKEREEYTDNYLRRFIIKNIDIDKKKRVSI
tara:strand:+ start:257 stop:490 length:234 start_codon:yes stop_codon:yes gene_type:complete